MSKHHLIKRALAGGLAIAAASFPAVAQATVYGGPNPDNLAPVSSTAPSTLPSNFYTDASSGGYKSDQASPSASSASVQARLAQLQSNIDRWFAAEGTFPPATSSAPSTATATSGGGFQWGDAGIGAAAATLLLGAGALGASVTRRRRRPVVS